VGYLSSKEAESLRKRADEYLQTYEFHMSNRIYALAMFDLEQALQLHVKASLLEGGIAYPRTHSIRRLLEILADVRKDEELKNIVKEYAVELRLLEEAYISSRYAVTDFREDEVLRVKKAFDEVLKHV
jgi:HEPN domain-containing protein